MPALSENSGHRERDQEKALKALFSKEDQAVLKQRLSQDAFRHFEDALHGKRARPTLKYRNGSALAERRRVFATLVAGPQQKELAALSQRG